MSPDERNEPRGPNGSTLERLTSFDDECKHLRVSLAEWGEETAPFGELPKQRLRNIPCARSHEDGVVRRVLPPPQCAISRKQGDVSSSRRANREPSGLQKWSNAFDREHLRGEMGEKDGLITRSGPNLEDALLPRELENFEIACVHARLRDRLTIPDRQRAVLVGTVSYARRYKEVTRREVERPEDGQICDSLLSEQLDESPPRPAVLRRYRSRHQSRCASSS